MFMTPPTTLRERSPAEAGQTLSEYGLILALIVVFALVALGSLGSAISSTLESIAAAL